MTGPVKVSAASAIGRAANQAAAAPAEASDGCYICQKSLWISVFFDEPRHDAKEEYGSDKLSNIGKLFHSHKDDPDKGIYRVYYNGLGVKFKEPNIARSKTAGKIGGDETKNTLADKAKDAGKAILTGKGKEALDDLKSPKKWGADIPGILAKIGIEALDPVRDNAAVSQVTLSGVLTRVDNALAKIAEIVKSQDLDVKHINIAVFGSGLGGAIARLFVNKLLAVCKQRGSIYYPTPGKGNGEATLEFHFLGLLDCVSATLDDSFLSTLFAGKLSMGFASLRIDGPMGIPEAVGRVVHFAAAHELRVTARLDSINKGNGQMMKEVALPGNHDDVVGNYQDGFQSKSAQLSRVALLRMHEEAFTAGVPIRSLKKLETQDGDLLESMVISASSLVHAGARRIPLDRLLLRYKVGDADIDAQLLEHARYFISWMRWRFDTQSSRGRPPERAYELVDKHITRLKSMVNHPYSTYKLTPIERALLEVWARPVKLDDYQMALFDDYVHDELYDSPFDCAAADWGNNGYFKIRGIDSSDELKVK